MVQARRDRDYHREALHAFESKISEEQRRGEKDIKHHKELELRKSDMVIFIKVSIFAFMEIFLI